METRELWKPIPGYIGEYEVSKSHVANVLAGRSYGYVT
jgi:hypothetical protein